MELLVCVIIASVVGTFTCALLLGRRGGRRGACSEAVESGASDAWERLLQCDGERHRDGTEATLELTKLRADRMRLEAELRQVHTRIAVLEEHEVKR